MEQPKSPYNHAQKISILFTTLAVLKCGFDNLKDLNKLQDVLISMSDVADALHGECEEAIAEIDKINSL